MVVTSVFQKLKALTWKNLIIAKRHWLSTLVKIAIPIAIFVYISYIYQKIRNYSDFKGYHNVSTYNPQRSSAIIFEMIPPDLKLYYTPQTKFTTSLIGKVQTKLNLDSASIVSFATENELIEYYQEHLSNINSLMGIIINGIEGEKIPIHLDYSIRPYLPGEGTPDGLFQSEMYMYKYVPDSGSSYYVQKGFIAIQLAVDTSFIEMNNEKFSFALFLQEFPYPPHRNFHVFGRELFSTLINATIFSLLTLSIDIVRRISEEKSTGIKELMKMMGLKSWMLWLGWFQHYLIINTVSVIIITSLLTISFSGHKLSILRYCSPSLFAVFLILYYGAGITFCFAICSLFSRPTLTVIVVTLAIIFTKLIPNAMLGSNPNWWKIISLALFPNMALTYGYIQITEYDFREVEVSWTNLFQPAAGGKEDVSLGNVFVMFLIDMVVYMLITLYFEKIKPGPYGLSKPYYFPITFLLEKIKKARTNQIECHDDAERADYCKIEAVSNLKVGIEIRNLYKKFGTYSAVNGFSIDIYEGQITALLGHNGAGKTTLMSIITGMIGASSGSVVVDGANINRDMNKIHGILGLCPQHNLQFTDLTVAEHLIFFGMLKGLTYRSARNETEILLEKLNIIKEKNTLPLTLSGGKRRRLSLGISLIGDSKVLILDEPTSGLDPEGRRAIWNMLLSLKGSRTIVLSTHYMDEADFLGDRIAIMDHGRLICYGTSRYLKKEYGYGYNITLILKSNKHVDDITKIVKSTIQTALLQSVSGRHLTYSLPHDTKPKFGTLLLELEKQKETLAITNIAISVTTLEDVFLKVGELTSGEAQSMRSQVNPGQKLIGTSLCIQQMKALLTKRFLTIKIKFSMFLITALLALAIILFLLTLGNTRIPVHEFKMTLSNYGETLVYYGPSSNNRDINEVKKIYAEQVQEEGSRSVLSNSVSDAIIAKGIENIAYYAKHMVISAEFNTSSNGETKMNAMYSNNALHGAPISLNMVTNAIVKALFGEDHAISTAHKPFREVDSLGRALGILFTALLWFVLFSLGLLLCTATFLTLPQMERVTKIKRLQLMCGVKSYSYWLSFYIVDLLLYWLMIISIIILILMFELWGSTPFSGTSEIYALFLILLVYGFCAIPHSYLYCYVNSPTGAFTKYIMVNLFGTIALLIITLYATLRNNYSLLYLLLYIPHFGLAYTIGKFSLNVYVHYNFLHQSTAERNKTCDREPNPCCDSLTSDECREYLSYFGGDCNISVELEIMMTSTFLYFAILLLLESNCIFKILEKIKLRNAQTTSSTEIVEHHDVDHGDDEDNALIVNRLTKIYGCCETDSKRVVRGISFAIKRGGCFGLLGVNGAGKTTTLRILTGDLMATDGDAEIRDSLGNIFKMSKKTKKYLKNISYCPQFDAIIDVLTGRQMLKLFAALRGEPKDTILDEINKWISVLGLQEYADKQCGTYSGGNKRKLSVAMAFVSNPLVVMLDEPTSGVDPISRRKLWKAITMLQKQEVQTSILLCSHSMDECEALCNRLTVMKGGNLERPETIPELKKRYGHGFTVRIKLKDSILNSVHERMSVQSQNELSNVTATRYENNQTSDDPKQVQQLMHDFEHKYLGTCKLCDKHSGFIHYRILDKNKKLGELFNEMEDFSHKHSIIEDYQIGDTTLEEVYISIVRS